MTAPKSENATIVPDGRIAAEGNDRWLAILLVAFFLVLLVRTAWLCDDAYITFRTVDNFVNGYGLRWNVVERVQTFTHPLWLFVFALPYSVTGEAYFTALAATAVLSLSCLWLIVGRIAERGSAALVAGVALVFSRSFVDYSTSGLENPLTHLLLALLVLAWRVGPLDGGRLLGVWLAGGALLLNRLDLALLIGPMLLTVTLKSRRGPALRAVALGLAPLACWEIFSLVYYGTLFPNTAYAKLQTGIASGELFGQGLLYLLDLFATDPVTPLVLLVTAAMLVRPAGRRHWPILVGIGLYLVYVVRVGGDFMSGRFITAPLLLGVATWARVPWGLSRAVTASMVAAVVFLAAVATPRLSFDSGPAVFARETIGGAGVADEMAFYYRYTGLLRYSRGRPLPWNTWVERGLELRRQAPVVTQAENVGFTGYYAGPAVTIIDVLGLCDPLLGRLPAQPGWRIGHYWRTVPDGYVETLQTGVNRIVDPTVAHSLPATE